VQHLVQIAGALLILSGFVLAQLGALDPRSLWYLVVNFVGSAVLAVDAYREAQWGFLLLELVWAIVSAAGLVRLVGRVRPRAGVRLQSDSFEADRAK
jgi:hypothetical protein